VTPAPPRLADQLRAALRGRLAHGDAKALAEAAGWQPANLSRFLAGKRRVDSLEALERLAAAAGIRLTLVE
jgi:transcriptional regulator with XRE-family HTH domain